VDLKLPDTDAAIDSHSRADLISQSQVSARNALSKESKHKRKLGGASQRRYPSRNGQTGYSYRDWREIYIEQQHSLHALCEQGILSDTQLIELNLSRPRVAPNTSQLVSTERFAAAKNIPTDLSLMG
jgi:hypothetical protein